ncbi:MAG: phospho-N-acetylmuramoyl-pentapeptide-transferase [Anaerolineae bacterium]|jgi:phospho-N-acetylmuramoyl-pentapeptide-transferase|nr:phospho-N-acetylmuramoyl-pentapeptide-transferase [Anaerolineae bacterium]
MIINVLQSSEISLALALATLSFMVTAIWGQPFIRLLHHFRIGKIVRVDGPERHQIKTGTPTMGGFLFILPVILLTILLNATSFIGFELLGESAFLPMLVLIAYSILGAIDDWEGIRGERRGLGMKASTKIIIQLLMALVIAYVIKYMLDIPDFIVPGFEGSRIISLGWVYIPVAALIIVGFSNAVNFTDGLDGLAGLISATCFLAFGIIAIINGQAFLGRFSFTLVGALFGFLWFNVHPAQLFMGDAGSLPLGATLAVVALMTGEWLLLPLIAVIPVSEVISVVLQVGYFKLTKGKRIFKMAPLHHHFELSGWSETQVVQRFWLISLLVTMLGIAISVL